LKRHWHHLTPRTGMVKPSELAAFHAAVMALPNPVHRDFLRLLLFCGLRREEAASLTWENVDFVDCVIRLPATATKAKRALDLPMVDVVRDMLVARRSLGKEKYVFPSNSKSGYIAEPKFPLNQVRLACGVKVTAHDLRRTFITIAESCDTPAFVLKALANHALGNSDMTERYLQMGVERLREPAQKICDRLKTLCGIDAPAGANIAKLKS
jgi:integrase